MKLFISYSNSNLEFINILAIALSEHVTPLYWEKDKEPGENDWETIFKLIDQCDLVLVVITDSAVRRGFSVGQEVGYAKKAGKKIIPFVSKGVKVEDVGFLKGTTAVHLDESNPQQSIIELHSVVVKLKAVNDVRTLVDQAKALPVEKQIGNIGGLLLIAGLTVLLFMSSEKK